MPDITAYYPQSIHGEGSINVRACGAKGDSLTDDTIAIQKAFDLAFGPKENPHGAANKHLNRAVYFPPGVYSVSSTLYLTAIHGGRIYSDSTGGCTISSVKTAAMVGTYWRPDEPDPKMTPVICMNCCSYFTFENIGVGISGNYRDNITDTQQHTTLTPFADCHTIFDICHIPDPANGVDGPSTMFQFLVVNMGGGKYCMRIGYMDDGVGNDNGVLYNCTLGMCEIAALSTESPSALNWSMIGGGAVGVCIDWEAYNWPTRWWDQWDKTPGTYVDGGNHGYLLEGAISVRQGSVSFIWAPSTGHSNWDSINAGGTAMSVQSGSSEASQQFSAINGSAFSVSGFAARYSNHKLKCCDAHDGSVIHYASSYHSGSLGQTGFTANCGNSGMVVLDCVQRDAESQQVIGYSGEPGGSIRYEVIAQEQQMLLIWRILIVSLHNSYPA